MLIVLLTVLTSGARPSALPDWQEPRLIKNILSKTEDSAFYPIGEMNGYYFFFAQHQGVNRDREELWRTDGTPGGTILLEQSPMDAVNSAYFIVGDKLLFLAPHPDYGTELWVSDGTPGNAQVMGDAFPDPFDGNVSNHTVSGNYLYFTAYDEVNLTELWRTDGTLAGMIRLTGSDIGLETNTPHNLIDVDGTLFFRGLTDDYDPLLLKSDGTVVGTTLVKQGEEMAFSGSMQVANGLLYFLGRDIWRSDGTTNGTYVIYSFPDDRGVPEYGSVAADSKIYYVVQDSINQSELWQSAGTAATTTKIADVTGIYGRMATVGNRLYFARNDQPHGIELWTSDGTPAGTKLVKDIWPGENSSMPDNLVAAGNYIYFKAGDETKYDVLWRSDGTTAGTVSVPVPGAPADGPMATPLAAYGDELFFQAAHEAFGREPWLTINGGTSAVFLVDLNQIDGLSSLPGAFHYVNDTLLFWTTAGLWRSDSSEAGTSLLVENVPQVREVRPYPMGVAGNKLFFLSDDHPNNTLELWRTDSGPAGTIHLRDLGETNRPDPFISPVDVNGQLYFALNEGEELWRSDGTPDGTLFIASPNPHPEAPSSIDMITAVGNGVFFVANNGANGPALWRSDGTSAGTVMVKDIHPAADLNTISQLTAVGGLLYFVADDAVHGAELWRSDGTAAGTVMVADVKPGAESSEPAELTAFRGVLYFVADNGANGREVWRATGDSATLLRDINPTGGSAAMELTAALDWLYFVAYDGQTGMQLWKSSGTAAGTSRVTLLTYPDFGGPHGLVTMGNFVFFSTSVFSTGMDNLYQSDGTAAGTIEMTEAFPEFQAYGYGSLTPAPGRLFFSATHLMYGNEPFVKPVSLALTTPAMLRLGEGEAFTQYQFRLGFRPDAPVTVTFSSDDPTVEIVPASVTIQPANWNAPLAIGVRADDDGQPGTRAATISQTLESTDATFDGAVITLPISIGWRFAYTPVVRR
jgi:ELWxxDGT repeat protein